MAYIGRSPQYGVFQTQTITANSVDTTFALDYVAASSAAVLVSIGGVVQQPEVAYSIASGGTQIVFTEAPDAAASVFITFLGERLTVPSVADSSIGTTQLANNAVTTAKLASSLGPLNISGGNITGLTSLTGANATFTGVVSALDFNSTSDIALKDNIITITKPLDVIGKLQPKEFTWKSTGNKSYGLIAQDVEQVLPSIVAEQNGYKGINYINIIAFLVEAVKELSAEVQELKKK